jgi:hypothetical protein
LTIPAADQVPRLRFWQWFNFVNASGNVEIQTSGSTNWQTLSATNKSIGSSANSGGGIWSRPTYDLTSYAGQDVQIAFHFTSGGNGFGSDPGWFIDDVSVLTNAPVFNNPENFENGLGDWSVDTGTWAVGKPTSGPGSAHGGTNCAGTILTGNYGWNVDTRLISPAFTVGTSPLFRFAQWYSFVNAGGFAEISTNGSLWQAISATNRSVGSGAVASGGWTNSTLDLSGFSGQQVQLAFHFQSGGSGFGSAAGWYVDDISLVARPVLTASSNHTVTFGQTFVVTNYVTNSSLPTATYTFSLVTPTTNAWLATNGVFAWTNTAAMIGTNIMTIKATDNSVPALAATNSFTVRVVPIAPNLSVLNSPTNRADFKFSFQAISNTTWRVEASSNLFHWQPIFTSTVSSSGVLLFTDLWSTNFSQRFYRTVFP